MGGTDVFKKLASREPLQGRIPYGRPFTVKEYATSVFSMNELPKDVEQTRAFFRRFLIIPFEVQIPEEDKDTELATKIISSEMSGVLNYVIRGVKSLLKSGGFDIPLSVQNAVERFRQESDSVLTFLDENGFQPSSEHWRGLQELYTWYRQQCTADGSCPASKRTFAKRLRDLKYTIGTIGKKKQTVVYMERAE